MTAPPHNDRRAATPAARAITTLAAHAEPAVSTRQRGNPMQISQRSALSRWLRTTRCAIGLAALSLLAAHSVRAEIVVGQVAPFSGPQAVTGKAVRAGAQLYFDS